MFRPAGTAKRIGVLDRGVGRAEGRRHATCLACPVWHQYAAGPDWQAARADQGGPEARGFRWLPIACRGFHEEEQKKYGKKLDKRSIHAIMLPKRLDVHVL